MIQREQKCFCARLSTCFAIANAIKLDILRWQSLETDSLLESASSLTLEEVQFFFDTVALASFSSRDCCLNITHLEKNVCFLVDFQTFFYDKTPKHS